MKYPFIDNQVNYQNLFTINFVLNKLFSQSTIYNS